MNSQEHKKPLPRFTLSGVAIFAKDKNGKRVLHAIDLTAVNEGKKVALRYPTTRDQAETLIGLIVPGIEKGINTFKALMRGEAVTLGKHTADELLEFVPFEGLEP